LEKASWRAAARDRAAEIKAAGASYIFGLSTQDTPYQKGAVERLQLPYPLLSDEHLSLAKALSLPTFSAAGMTLLKRMTMVINDGVIEHVFYPVFPPDQNATDVLSWLERCCGKWLSNLEFSAPCRECHLPAIALAELFQRRFHSKQGIFCDETGRQDVPRIEDLCDTPRLVQSNLTRMVRRHVKSNQRLVTIESSAESLQCNVARRTRLFRWRNSHYADAGWHTLLQSDRREKVGSNREPVRRTRAVWRHAVHSRSGLGGYLAAKIRASNVETEKK
jgi:redoxin